MSLILRGTKGAALTHAELDNNQVWLRSRDIVSASVDVNNNLILTKDDFSYYSVPLSGIGTTISGLTFSGNVLTITQSNGSSVSVNISSVDIRVTDLIYSGSTLYLNQSDGSQESVFIPQFTGGTVNGYTIFNNGLSANTFTTNSLTLNGVTITGFTDYVFTGNTSGDCITDLFVSNVNSCSPLHIQPLNTGDVYIGENGGVNVGIGTNSPTRVLDSRGTFNLQPSTNTFLRFDGTLMEAQVGSSNNQLTLNRDNQGITDLKGSGSVSILNTTYSNSLSIGTNTILRENDKIVFSRSDNAVVGWWDTLNYRFRVGTGMLSPVYSSTTETFEVVGTSKVTGNVGIGITGSTDSTSRLQIKGSDSSSSNYGLKVQNSGGTDNFVVRNDGKSTFSSYGLSPSVNGFEVFGNSNLGFAIESHYGRVKMGSTFNSATLNIIDYGLGNFISFDGSIASARGLIATNGGLDIFGRKDLTGSYETHYILSSDGHGVWTNTTAAFKKNVYVGDITEDVNTRLTIKGETTDDTKFALKVQDSGGTNTLQVRNDGLVEFGDTSQTYNKWLQYTGGTLKVNYTTTSNFYWDGSQLQLTGLNGNGNSKLEFTSIAAREQTLVRSYNTEKLSFATNGGNANMQLSSNGDLYIGSDTSSGVTASARLEVRGSGTTSSGYGLKVQDSSGTNNFVVRNDGNVGVGEPSPIAKLSVLTTDNLVTSYGIKVRQNVTGDDLFFIKGNGDSAFTQRTRLGIGDLPSATYRVNIQGQSGAIPTDKILGVYNFGASLIGLVVTENTNVGVGKQNQTPTARLHVEGINTLSSDYALKVDDRTSASLFYVRNDGNVGIGTSTPTERLEVNGKTKTTTLQVTSGSPQVGYVLTATDTNGNTTWSPVSGITGVGNVTKYTTTLTFTDGETKTITHNLNTKFVHCSVWDVSTNELISPQVARVSGNETTSVNITIATAGNYDILITG